MTKWNDGYVADVAYGGAVYREFMPAQLDVVCLTAGVAPPVEPDAPFTYCELGCGLGDTALSVAASNRQARVWGFDFNPAHVAIGRANAARGGLTNIELAERSFEELALAPAAELPPLDYVTLHGVWSWISPANQAHIVTILRRYLRPGGIACVTYNAMPGWGKLVGLQRLLFEAGHAAGGDSEHRIREALAFVRRMVDAKCEAVDPVWLERLEVLAREGETPYLSHEYLNEYWRPVFHREVVAAMAEAKLTYVGSATIFDNFPQFCMRPEQVRFVSALSPELRQTAEDAFSGRMFRRDVFVRGARPLPPPARSARIGAQRLMMVVPPRNASLKIKVPVGEATLNEAFYGPALATLGRGEASVADLLAGAAPGTAPARAEVLGMLIGARQVFSVPNTPDAAALAVARRYNQARLAIYAEESRRTGWLVGARIGSAIPVGLDEMLVFEVVADGQDRGVRDPDDAAVVVAGVRALMDRRGMSLKTDGPEGAPDVDGDIRQILGERVPIWRAIGAL